MSAVFHWLARVWAEIRSRVVVTERRPLGVWLVPLVSTPVLYALLTLIERRLTVQSAPDWMRRTVAKAALPLQDALRSMVVETAKRQAIQPDGLADTLGVADWK